MVCSVIGVPNVQRRAIGVAAIGLVGAGNGLPAEQFDARRDARLPNKVGLGRREIDAAAYWP